MDNHISLLSRALAAHRAMLPGLRARLIRLALLGAIALLLGIPPAVAMEKPCALAGNPAGADPEQPPEIAVWSGKMVPDVAGAPTCERLPLASAKMVIVMRGSFRFGGSLDDLLGRIGAISTLAHMRYWSVTDKKWLEFIADAYALSLPVPEYRRTDFTAAELRSSDAVHYSQQDNRSSHPVIYRMRVRVTGLTSAIIDTENVTAVSYLFIPLFPANTLHSEVHLQRLASGVWEILQVDWVGPAASAFAHGHEASYVNRTAAVFRHIAGIPSDQEPPAAP